MTPAPVARFMASLFNNLAGRDCRLLDAGAGVGALTAAFVDRLCGQTQPPRRLVSTLYEIDAHFTDALGGHAGHLPPGLSGG